MRSQVETWKRPVFSRLVMRSEGMTLRRGSYFGSPVWFSKATTATDPGILAAALPAPPFFRVGTRMTAATARTATATPGQTSRFSGNLDRDLARRRRPPAGQHARSAGKRCGHGLQVGPQIGGVLVTP